MTTETEPAIVTQPESANVEAEVEADEAPTSHSEWAAVTGAGTREGAGAEAVEVDQLDDDESAYEDTISTYTASLASSVVNYPMENGRRYHAFRAGHTEADGTEYSRPNDELEMERLMILHRIMAMAIGGLYMAPIDPEKTQRVLDIGTGTGVWAMAIADDFPNATVIGNDLSANMPTFVPPNVRFEVDDVESPWLYEEKFNWIFSRYMAASIKDWPALVNSIYENLKPGGWAEFQDFDLQYYSEDGSLRPEHPMLYWISTLLDAARTLGRDPNPGSKLEGWVGAAGFRNVEHRRFRIPIGAWPRDPVLKEIGMCNHMQISQGLEGLSLRLFANVLHWDTARILALMAKVRQDLKNPNIHGMMDL